MPGLKDKIIINSARDEGNHASIQERLSVLKELADEIVTLDLLKQAESIRQKLEPECLVFNKSQVRYCQALDAAIDESSALINSKVLP